MGIIKSFYDTLAKHRQSCTWVLALTIILAVQYPLSAYGHEHSQTHRRLTLAAVEFLDPSFFSYACAIGSDTNCSIEGFTKDEIKKELAQGAIDEDQCIAVDNHDMQWDLHPNWNSHFYDPTGKINIKDRITVAAALFSGCNWGDGSDFVQTTAAARAGDLWRLAEARYKGEDYLAAYRLLGRVLHLLQDMASPAHSHVDPHGQARAGQMTGIEVTDGILNDCGGDSDDFERWGFCFPGILTAGKSPQTHILDYFRFAEEPENPSDITQINSEDVDNSNELKNITNLTAYKEPLLQDLCDPNEFGIVGDNSIKPRPGMTCRMWKSLTKLYNAQPQGDPNSLDPVNVIAVDGDGKPNEPNLGYAYVRHVAQVVYDFTTYRVKLKDDTIKTDLQADSELRRMLRGSGFNDCGAGVIDNGLCDVAGGWTISGDSQEIGWTLFACGNQEGKVDTLEEWWVMEQGCKKRTTRDQACVWRPLLQRYDCTNIPGPQAVNNYLDGYAYIENTGGEGPAGLSRPIDNFIPVRFGCGPGEGGLCGDVSAATGPRSKPIFRQLYGTTANQEDVPGSRKGKTLNRIYGDVLYPTAVAYAAGLIQSFVSEQVSVAADAGGPYEGCFSITLDASGSSTPNTSIVSYEWDFEDDGTFDLTTGQAQTDHIYLTPFTGLARLRITDSDGEMAEDTAEVTITGISPPVITEIKSLPGHLWPPNHEMIPVSLTPLLEGACDVLERCQITDVTITPVQESNNNRDWDVTGNLTVLLRAVGYEDTQTIREYDIKVVCDNDYGSTTQHLIVKVDNLDNEETTLTIEGSDNNNDGGTGGINLPIILLLSIAYALRRRFA